MFFFIMYFDYLLEPLPPLYELARPDRWKFDTMLLVNMLWACSLLIVFIILRASHVTVLN
jgi:hypothetical protein